ncbi:hypothetical protein IX39_10225 [Chryseobacterium formosense]|uniref:Outer membrane protein beta-barrel domain-containing protein n=1 Tax=Chryseobacterium formosense TaxID=236814 RepID=A0A085Z957_9FLAO|nr:hypothetical protein [Chryseobacterium formosense]KFF00971.1 hypothetical protein IX39_10225 [Chryseobacterium formosense]SFT40225.1 hypothetical protein SAMN05421857_0740 [Chryseobacterium formosense]
MRQKILLAGFFLTLFSLSYSQNKETLRKQMERYTNKIDSIVTEERNKMNAEFDALEKKMKAGEISESEMKEQKNTTAVRYEAIINDEIAKQKDEYEEITGKTVRKALFKSNFNKKNSLFRTARGALLDLTFEQPEFDDPEDPKNYLQSFGYVAGISLINFTDKKFFDFSKGNELKNSSSGNFTLRYENQLGKTTSPVFYRVGLGWRLETIIPNGDKIFTQDDKNLYLTDFTGNNFKKAWLRTDYIYVPLEAIFVLNPKYKEYNGVRYIDNTKKQLRIGIGLYGGVKINDRMHLQYKNDFGNKVYVREGVSKGLNPFIAGGKISIEYFGFNIYVMKDFTPIFNNEALIRNKSGVQIGIDLWALTF